MSTCSTRETRYIDKKLTQSLLLYIYNKVYIAVQVDQSCHGNCCKILNLEGKREKKKRIARGGRRISFI